MAKENGIRIEPETRQPYDYAARLVAIKRELYRLDGRKGDLMAEQDGLLEVLGDAMEPGQSRDLLVWATGDAIHLNLERDSKGELFAAHVLLEPIEQFTWPMAEGDDAPARATPIVNLHDIDYETT